MREKLVSALSCGAIFLIGALLSFAVGCSKHASDDTIAKDVQNKVAVDPVTKDSAVSVTAKDGKVTLRGTVKDPATQQRVEQIAHEEPGTTGVDDEMAVVPSGVPASEQTSNAPAPAPVPAPPVEQTAPAPQPIVVPAGTTLTVTMDQALSSKTSESGQAFLATLARPVTLRGNTAIPKG